MSHRPTIVKPPPKVIRPSGLAQPKTRMPTAVGKVAAGSQSGTAKSVIENLPPTVTPLGSSASDLLDSGTASVDAVEPPTTDEFRLGDCVWVSGVKKGTIAFIGETQFAQGVWAGILLDEPIGKNDGRVNGVRYFACQPLHGIFAKLNALTSRPIDTTSGSDKVPVSADVLKPSDAGSDGVGSSVSGQSDCKERVQASNEDTLPADATVSRPSKLQAPSSRSSGLARLSRSSGNASSSSSSLSQTAAAANQLQSETGNVAGSLSALKVGDRVVVGGNKAGTLRYFGTTHFAKGEWAGIELDEPVGKNDGSVESKRYFSCTPLCGLFAPVSKVTVARAGAAVVGSAAAAAAATSPPRRQNAPVSTSVKRPTHNVPLVSSGTQLHERSCSRESLSSMSSVTSSASRSRVRLGVTAIKRQATKPVSTNQANVSSLQKALKEKEEHIEQLLVERDLERSEFARMASRVDEVEGQLAAVTTKHDRLAAETEDRIKAATDAVDDIEQEKQQLRRQLEERQRKIEDLQFSVEEASIDRSDFELKAEHEARRFRELENQLRLQTERTEELQRKLASQAELLESNVNDHKQQTDIDKTQRELETSVSRCQQLEADKLLLETELASRSEELMTKISDLTKQNEALQALVGDSETDRTMLSDSDKLISELKDALASAVTDNQAKSVELKALSSSVQSLTHQLDASKVNLLEITESRDSVEEEKQKCLAEQLRLTTEIQTLRERLGNAESLNRSHEAMISEQQKHINELLTDHKQADKLSETNNAATLQQLVAENATLLDAKATAENAAATASSRVEMERIARQNLEAELQRTLEKLSSATASYDKLQQRELELRLQVEQLNGSNETLKSNNEALSADVVRLSQAVQHSETKNEQSLKEQMCGVEQRYRHLTDELQLERDALQATVSSSEIELQQRSAEVQQLQDKMAELREENSALRKQLDSAQSVTHMDVVGDAEVAGKVDKNANLQMTSDELSAPRTDQLGNSEAVEQQVKFLNSVIVDLKSKNAELQQQLDMLLSADDADLYDVDVNRDFSEMSGSARKVAPRLFCDICDMFDLHDTDDCPVQASSSSPMPVNHQPSHSSGRPYCDICEVFGHTSEECDDQLTF